MSDRYFDEEGPRRRRRRREGSRDRLGGQLRLRGRSRSRDRSPSPPQPTGAGAPRRRRRDDDESSYSDSTPRSKLSRNVGFDRQKQDAENAAKVAVQLEKINAQRTMLQPVYLENPEVEAFLRQHPEVEPRASAQLRAMPHEQARMVISGPLDRARNKTAVILSRIKNLSMGLNPTGVQQPGMQATPQASSTPGTSAGETNMDELMAKLNADLAKEEAQRRGAKGEDQSRPYSGRISAEPVPAGGGARGERKEAASKGEPLEDDIPIELPPDPGSSRGASSSRLPSSGTTTSKPKGVIPRPFASNPFHRRPASPKKKEVEHLEPVPVPVATEAAVSRPILGDYAAAPGADAVGGTDSMDSWQQQMSGSWEQQDWGAQARPVADLEADARFRLMAAKFRAEVQQWKEASAPEEPTDTVELPPNPDGPVKPGPIAPGPVQGKGTGKDTGGAQPWLGLKGPGWPKGKDKGCSKGKEEALAQAVGKAAAMSQAVGKAAAMAPLAEAKKGKGKGDEEYFGGGEDYGWDSEGYEGYDGGWKEATPDAGQHTAPQDPGGTAAKEAPAAAEARAAEPEAKPPPARGPEAESKAKPNEVPSFASILEKMRALKNKPTTAAAAAAPQGAPPAGPPSGGEAGAAAKPEAGAEAKGSADAVEAEAKSADTPSFGSILEKMRALKSKPAGKPSSSEPPPESEPPAGLTAMSNGSGLTGTLAALARQVGMVTGEAEEPAGAAAAAEDSPEVRAQAEQAKAAASAAGASPAQDTQAWAQDGAAGGLDPSMAAMMGAGSAGESVEAQMEAARTKQYEAYWIQCQQAAHQALFASQGSVFGGGGSWETAQASIGGMDSGSGMGSGGMGKGGFTPRTNMLNPNSRPGDWQCPQCGDHQFSRNKTCRQCGASRPPEIDLLLQDVNVPPHLQALIAAHHAKLQQEHEEKEALEQARRKGRGKWSGKGKDWD